MNKVLWGTLLVAPAFFAAALFAAVPAIATENQLSAEAQVSETSSNPLAPVALPELAPLQVDDAFVVAPVPAQIAQVAAPVASAVEVAPAAPSVDSLSQVVEYTNEGNSG
ncbi:MAG: hypothetical protein HC781_18935, partial [Leptolyngbyaceae cyanobacterium CSU_1_4]|nr:hypothetical protein [Leptolyngbyaceae cyanobacterium CSU_1_4]